MLKFKKFLHLLKEELLLEAFSDEQIKHDVTEIKSFYRGSGGPVAKAFINALRGIETGKISLIISKSGNGVQLDMRDSGKGINRLNWKNIFRPGYSSKQRGWGLGLSLTQRIVEEIHGGSIRVLSSKPGKTIFRINFPK